METFFRKNVSSVYFVSACCPFIRAWLCCNGHGIFFVRSQRQLSLAKTNQTMGFFQDFKAFAMKGNVVDLAVGVVIGGAFGKIVTAMVDDIIMPFVSLITGGGKFTDFNLVLKPGKDGATEYTTLEAAKTAGANVLAYGHLIQTVVDFFIVAMCIFIVLKGLMRLQKKKEVEEAAPPAPSSTDVLLAEIRDELRKKQN